MFRNLMAFAIAMVFLAMPFMAQSYDVGDQQDFYVWDLSVMPPADDQITATCRGEGDYVYVFIEDNAWGNSLMDADDVDAVIDSFETSSPAGSYNPDWGIYRIETEVFGMPSDVDNDPKIVLLFYELACFEGTCFDGFFRASDLTAGTGSNMTEMLHINISDEDPTSDYMLGVLAHEFNHMIHTAADPYETMWLSESMAEAAMIVTGYNDDGWLHSFKNQSYASFWGDEYTVHYGASLVFGTFLYNILGNDISDLMADTETGFDPVQLIFAQHTGDEVSFFEELAMSIYENDIPPLDLSDLRPIIAVDETPYDFSRTVSPGSIHFIDYDVYADDPGPFTMALEGAGIESLTIFLAETGDGGTVNYTDYTGETQFCLDNPTGQAYSLILINSTTANTVTYDLSTAMADSCDAADDDDDDSATTDDDDDSTGNGGDDDDDDDGGCGC